VSHRLLFNIFGKAEMADYKVRLTYIGNHGKYLQSKHNAFTSMTICLVFVLYTSLKSKKNCIFVFKINFGYVYVVQ
jgi:hypothetical protein